MKKIIHNLRKRPEEERRHILHSIIFLCAIIVIIIWIYSLGTHLTKRENIEPLKDDLEPFSDLSKDLSNDYKDFNVSN